MEYDYERGKQKEEEILEKITSYLANADVDAADRRQVAEIIASTSIRVTPPEVQRIVLHLVTLHASGRGGGKSSKPGNIRLNIGKLMEGVANGVFAVVSSYQIPWLAPFAFIMLWKSLWDSSKVDLTENDAAVIYSMWIHSDNKNEIPKRNLLQTVNMHLQRHNCQPITQKDLDFSISSLIKVGCIKESSTNRNNWWLCEWVQPIYR